MFHENRTRLASIIQPHDQVLDVGGWHAPLNRANVILDIMPYRTRNRRGAIGSENWPDEYFNEMSYHQLDICGPNPWPFRNKQFDFVLCSHTLEDVRDPIFVCREINRVGKSGYIEVPSRLVESMRGIERPFFCGYYHHRWLCEVENTSIAFQFKPAMLHAYRQFYLRKPWFRTVRPERAVSYFFWEGEFQYCEKILIDRDAVQNDLRRFRQEAKKLKNIFMRKNEEFNPPASEGESPP